MSVSTLCDAELAFIPFYSFYQAVVFYIAVGLSISSRKNVQETDVNTESE